LLSLSPQKRFELESGTIRAVVAPQPPGQPLIVKTEYADTIVIGTEFFLSSRPEQTGLTVEHGTVKLVQPDNSTTLVSAGTSAVSTEDEPITIVSEPAGIKPVALLPKTWIKGLESWSPAGDIQLIPATKPKDWHFSPGASWNEDGSLKLTSGPKKNSGFRAVSPNIKAGPNETFIVRGLIQARNGARFNISLYQLDSEKRRLGKGKVPGEFTSSTPDLWAPFEVQFTTTNSPELSTIAIALHCHNAHGLEPLPEDEITVKDLKIIRR
jgi:hypothetical protein